MALEVTTVADDTAVLFDGTAVERLEELAPATAYCHRGVPFCTLPRPAGERLATVATVNDLHFGEVECGRIEGLDIGPVLSVGPGEEPYPEVMNRGAIAEMAAVDPDAVVAKGDLTSAGHPGEYQRFLDWYRGAFGERLVWVRGNHDTGLGASPPHVRTLPGVILAVIDTVVEGRPSGRVDPVALDWLDDLGRRADRPVLIFGHHHPWDPASRHRPDTYFGIHPDDSEALVSVVARRPPLVGYFAGHTHRNRVRRFSATGPVPWVEVACVKDFPGTWTEYRVFEGGILQVNHRIAAPDALRWSEACRAMLGGLYPAYAAGRLSDGCFPVWPR
jgi:3',5'-cyclic AMP phosphodiesterase CpdA